MSNTNEKYLEIDLEQTKSNRCAFLISFVIGDNDE